MKTFNEIYQIYLKEAKWSAAMPNPNRAAQNLFGKYLKYAQYENENKKIKLILDEYINQTTGIDGIYVEKLSNGTIIQTKQDAAKFIDEIISILRKRINEKESFFIKLKKYYLLWWDNKD